MIRFDVDASDLRTAKKALKRGVHRRALSKAGTEATRRMKAATQRRVRAKKKLKLAFVNKMIKVVKPRGKLSGVGDLNWGIKMRGDVVPLMQYKPRQVAKGVTVEVKKGKRSLVRGAFIVTLDHPTKKTKKGHTGVFRRKGKGRFPIHELLGSRPVDQMLKQGEPERILGKGRRTFGRAFRRLLKVERKKARR